MYVRAKLNWLFGTVVSSFVFGISLFFIKFLRVKIDFDVFLLLSELILKLSVDCQGKFVSGLVRKSCVSGAFIKLVEICVFRL